MKKIYLCLIALITVVSACTKVQPEKALTPAKNFGDIKSSFVVEDDNFYVDLDLIPRAPGENYDTYHCLVAGKDIYVNNVYWDSTTYPSLYTGVPLYGEVHSGPEPGNTSGIFPYTTYASQTGIGGTTFTLTIPTLCGVPDGSQMHTDIDRYLTALSSYVIYTGPNPTYHLPYLGDYVATDYFSSANCPQTTISLKLIRSSTSSTGFAVANSKYPATITFPIATVGCYAISGKYYFLQGIYSKGIINALYLYGTSYKGTANGTFTNLANGNIQFVGSFIDEYGNNVPFNFVGDGN